MPHRSPAEAGETYVHSAPQNVEESMPSIEESLDRLAGVAGRLNQETDTLNWVIEAVENRLQSMNLGVTCWDEALLDAEDEPGESTLTRYMHGWVVGHTKIDDRWRLAVKQVRTEDGYFEGDLNCPYRNVYDISEPKPLIRASRLVRVQAVGRLGELVERLAEQVTRYVEEIGQAKSLVTDDPSDLASQ